MPADAHGGARRHPRCSFDCAVRYPFGTGNHSCPPTSCGTQQFTGAGQPLNRPLASFAVCALAAFSDMRCTWFTKYVLFFAKPPSPFDMYAAGAFVVFMRFAYTFGHVRSLPAF